MESHGVGEKKEAWNLAVSGRRKIYESYGMGRRRRHGTLRGRGVGFVSFLLGYVPVWPYFSLTAFSIILFCGQAMFPDFVVTASTRMDFDIVRILVNATPLLYVNTGIARYLRCLYTAMDRLYGDTCSIAYFDGRTVSNTMPTGPENSGKFNGLANLFWKLPPRIALTVRKTLQYRRQKAFDAISQDYDVYHEAGFFPFMTPKNLKTVFTIHDCSIQRHPEHHPKERVLFMNKYFAPRAQEADAILTVSDFSKSEILNYTNIAADRITVTPLSHDAELFQPPSAQTRSRLDAAGIPQNYFLFVGSGDPRKNISVIPLALRLAQLDIPFVNVGWSGWSMAEDNDIIHAGYVSDEKLALLYQGASAFLFPSLYEGFGLPILEAMACGCPVITTRKASLPEVAQDAALYVTLPQDPQKWADALQRIAKDPSLRDSLVEKALSNAKKFSWETTAHLTMQTFKQTLGMG